MAVGSGVTADKFADAIGVRSLCVAWYLGAAAMLVASALIKRRGRVNLAAALLLLSLAMTGAAWHDWRWSVAAPDDLAFFARETPAPSCVELILADRVKVSPPPENQPLRPVPGQPISEAIVHVAAIRDGTRWRSASGYSRLRVAGVLPALAPGDRVRAFGQLAQVQAVLNPGQFDWAAAERRGARLSEVFCNAPACIELLQKAESNNPRRALHRVRTWCTKHLAGASDARDAPLVLATLLGDQERLSDSTKDAFLETGSIHLLVISGMHIAMVGAIIWHLAALARLPGRWQFSLTTAVVLAYAAVVGPEPSVVRATVLAVATIIALAAGRQTSAGNLFGAAALVVMAVNPSEIFRAGTQFSFLAVAVLLLLARGRRTQPADPLRQLIEDSRPWIGRVVWRLARNGAAVGLASLAVGIAMSPLVAHHFHVVTPASIVLTPIASPLIALALAAGLATLAVGWLVPPLAPVLGAVCGSSLHATETLVRWAQQSPGSYWYANGPPAWWLIGFYGAIGVWAVFPRWRPKAGRQVVAALFWVAVGYASIGATRTGAEELRCTFLAVGHGTCVVLELPGGEVILYDAGTLGSPEIAYKTASSFLWHRGIDRIDAIVLSHADIDHYNGVPGLLERFPVRVAYISPMMFDPLVTRGRLEGPDYLRRVLAEQGTPLREVWMGDRLRTSDARVEIEVLHPPRDGVPGTDNANSLMLSIEFAGRRILLPGDLEEAGLQQVMSDPPLDCDVLLAPHHGSAGSDPPGFAAWTRPEWVVMSGRTPDRTLTASESYEGAGATVLHTARHGAIICAISDQGVQASTYRQVPISP